MSQPAHQALLLAGVPRVGSSWIAQVLGQCGVRLLNEPDNEAVRPEAVRAKLGLGRHPALAAGDSAPRYEQLWAAGLGGGSVEEGPRSLLSQRLLRSVSRAQLDRAFAPPGPVSPRIRLIAALAPKLRCSGDDVLVKSVHAALALDWLAARFAVRVMAVSRDALDVTSSWLELGLSPRRLIVPREVAGRVAAWLPDPAETEVTAWAAANVAVLLKALEDAAGRHGWLLVRHERLCDDPHGAFADLAGRIGLAWTGDAARFLEASQRPGQGYSVARIASRTVGAWRGRLTAREATLARTTIARVRGEA